MTNIQIYISRIDDDSDSHPLTDNNTKRLLTLDRDIHFVPFSATVCQKISIASVIPFSQAVCQSPFFNKF